MENHKEQSKKRSPKVQKITQKMKNALKQAIKLKNIRIRDYSKSHDDEDVEKPK